MSKPYVFVGFLSAAFLAFSTPSHATDPDPSVVVDTGAPAKPGPAPRPSIAGLTARVNELQDQLAKDQAALADLTAQMKRLQSQQAGADIRSTMATDRSIAILKQRAWEDLAAADAPTQPAKGVAAANLSQDMVDALGKSSAATTKMNSAALTQAASPNGTAVPDGQKPVVKLEASTDTKTASVTAAFSVPLQPIPDVAQSLSFSVTAQTPVGQGVNYTNVATLDGMTKSTAIGFQLNYITEKFDAGSVKKHYFYDDLAHQMLCKTWLAIANDGSPSPLYVDHESQKADCMAGYINDSAAANTNLSLAQRAQINKAIAILNAKENSYEVLKVQPFWLFSLNGKMGGEDHTYYNGVTLAKSTVTKTPYQFGGAATWDFNEGNSSLSLLYNYQLAYADSNKGTAQVLCPLTGVVVLKCINGFVGAPTQRVKDLMTVDLRSLVKLPSAFQLTLGLDPAVTYDAAANSYAVQFPIYFLKDATNGLSGGIRYDWTSSQHVSVVGVFVASSFCVLPGANACVAPKKAGSGG